MYNYFWSYIGSHHVCFSKQIFSSHYNTFISYDNVKPCKCFPLLFPTLWKFIHICRINHIAVFFFGLANKLRPSVCHPGMPLLAPGNLIVFFLLIVFLDRCRITFIRLLFHTFQLSSHFEHFFFFFCVEWKLSPDAHASSPQHPNFRWGITLFTLHAACLHL